jgi:hypothetical protein
VIIDSHTLGLIVIVIRVVIEVIIVEQSTQLGMRSLPPRYIVISPMDLNVVYKQ